MNSRDIERTDRQKRLFKLKRGGEVLTAGEVKEIKEGRKKLRREMKAEGKYSRHEFELTASSLGLYFDKRRGILPLLFGAHGLGILIGAGLLFLGTMLVMSVFNQLSGNFTIALSNGLYKEGFTLCEHADFENPVLHLFCEPATACPAISITELPDDIDDIDGEHHDTYFAYTFYIKNEGETTVNYNWELTLNDEENNLSDAAWIMLYEDGKQKFYAKPSKNGGAEALPAFSDNNRGYTEKPLAADSANPGEQYQRITVNSRGEFNRIIPYMFKNEKVAVAGKMEDVRPKNVHKYTVVIWLEGDDPECTNAVKNGMLSFNMQFRLESEQESTPAINDVTETSQNQSWWDRLWSKLK